MSQLKPSVVILKKGVDVDAFVDEMNHSGSTSPSVPTRSVNIFDIRPTSIRSVEFMLTAEEVLQLRNDERVESVRWGTKAENGIATAPSIINTADLPYTRSPVYVISDKSDLNWGLLDCYSNVNPFNYTVSNPFNFIVPGPSGPRTVINSNRGITLTGTGVDVVIMDSGLQVNHPEFTNANGVSRVQQINWWASAGYSNTTPYWTPDPTQNNMPTGFYTDTTGHGTHVASIAVGKNYGWATEANIYVMNVLGPTGSIPTNLGFDLIRRWHELKPTNASTGYKKPTVINCSFGSVFINVENVTGGLYRNTIQWIGNINSNEANTYGMIFSSGGYPIIDDDEKEAVENAIDSGVIVIAAAGNNGYKIDIVNGSDYNNYATYSTANYANGQPIINSWYYHRGSTPAAVDGVTCVGAVDYTYDAKQTGVPLSYPPYVLNSNATAKAYFSACGPRIDVYAPGGMVAGATSNSVPLSNTGFQVTQYYLNPSFKQQKNSGTSQASPQVTGIVSCVVESNPNFNSSDAVQWVSENSITTKLSNVATPNTNPYLDQFNLQGSPNRYLYMPFQTGVVATILGGANITGGGVNL